MESAVEYWTARAWLEWQVELGADEAMLDAPIDRYALDPEPARPAPAIPAATGERARPAPPPPPEPAPAIDAPAEAARLAASAKTVEDLAEAMAAFDLCELKKGARNFVFADGNPAARVMIIGEAPGRDEDLEGRPFVGRAGQLLDRMFAAIDMARDHPSSQQGLYITNVMPWRPPSNRTPDAAEIAMMLPFLKRHVEIVAPDVIVLMGNTPCQAVLGRSGITRMRGTWAEAFGKPVLPMFHPAYLLRTPAAKREAWADLLALQARLREGVSP